MTVRSVVISFFILSIAMSMSIAAAMNAEHQALTGHKLFDDDRAPYMTYSQMGIPQDKSGYNDTVKDLTTYVSPGGEQDEGFFQNIRYGSIILDTLFNATLGFPAFLVSFGMPTYLETPLFMFVVLNHILAVIYIVTGRTFVY